MSKVSLLLVILLVFSAFSVAFAMPAASANAPTRRLGFWLQEGNIDGPYSASSFFNAMFLTPPYPASAEIMIFGIQQAYKTNMGCSANSGPVGESITFWGNVAQLADAYPNIRLVYEIAFVPNTPPYDINCFNTMVQAFSSHPSVYGIGVEGEYTNAKINGLTQAIMQTAYNDVVSTGKQFINYYIKGGITVPAGGYQIYHTNFPMQGDQVGTLSQHTDSQAVGISSGYYDNFQFPSTFTCPIGANDVATGALITQPQGWNKCVVSTELSAAVSSSASARQFVEFAVGFSSSGYFTGASGQSTNQMWDNPTLRNWIWTDPNNGPNFITSASSSPPPPTTTTTSSMTTVLPPPPPSTGSPQLSVSPTSIPYDAVNGQTLGYGITAGPPGVGYTIRLKTPDGSLHNLATGTLAPNGTAEGTLSYTFDVPNGVFNVKARFANGAGSNVIGIQIGSPSTTSASTTTTYVSLTTSLAVISTSSSSTLITSTSSTSTAVTSTSSASTVVASASPTKTTTSTTTDNGDYNHRNVIPSASPLQTPTTTSSTSVVNNHLQDSGFSSATGLTTGLVLGVTAGMALGSLVLIALGRSIGDFSWRGSSNQSREEQEETEESVQKNQSKSKK
jgi:hypothetical protein